MELSQSSKQGEHLLIKKLILFFLMHMSVCTGVVIHEESGHGVQKKVQKFLELELQTVVSHQTCVLGTEFMSLAEEIGSLSN